MAREAPDPRLFVAAGVCESLEDVWCETAPANGESQVNAFDCDESHCGLVGIFERGPVRPAILVRGSRVGKSA